MPASYRAVNNAAGQSAGTTTTPSTTAITPTLPNGSASGDRVFVLQQAWNTAGSTPANWNELYKDVIIGSGTPAAGSGQRRISCYWRDYDGAWSMPSFPLTSAAQNSHNIIAVTLTKAANETWDDPTYSATGEDFGTADNSFSTTTSSAFTTITDAVLLAQAVCNDNVTISSGAITGTNNLSLSGVAERADGGTATGYDVSGKLHTATVSAAADPAGTLSHTGTLSGSSQGGVRFIQQTVTAPPEGAASSAYGWASSAAGEKNPAGTSSSAYSWASDADGEILCSGDSSSTYDWASSASGELHAEGTTGSAYGWVSTADGELSAEGATSSAYSWTSSASGHAPTGAEGAASSSYGWASTAVGEQPPIIIATVTLVNADSASINLNDIGAAMVLGDEYVPTLSLNDVGATAALTDRP